MTCPICRHPNHPTAHQCTGCGAPLILQAKYQITQLLDRARYSTTYLGNHIAFTGVSFAIKEIMPDSRLPLAEQQQDETQFHLEANLLTHLQHPALSKVWDHFSENNRLYLVMEYVAGETLARQLNILSAPLSETQVGLWAQSLCAALTYLHMQTPPIVHHAIEPRNIVPLSDSQIKLIDFGLPKQIISAPYTPIEQYGSGGDERSDIYGLGVTMYQLLTNHLPPSAPDRIAQPTVALRQLNPMLSPALEAIVQKAMAERPGDRFQSAAALHDALQNPDRILIAAQATSTVASILKIVKILTIGGSTSAVIGVITMLFLSLILIIIIAVVILVELSYLNFRPG